MTRIISLNANGIRAAARKGFFEWLPSQNADVICIQETKAQVHQLEDPQFHPEGYVCQYVDAVKKGYSGTAIYSRVKPKEIITKMGCEEFDNEGRYVEAVYDKHSVISLYAPSGSSGEHRQESKERFMVFFMEHLKKLKRKRREFIICGDWNIAHHEVDLKNWKGNKKNSGFLPHEREWLTTLFDEVGYIDGFREIEQEPDQYTWWSNRGQAWAKNVGWRLDYQILSPKLRGSVKSTAIYKDERFSDHAPLIMDYDFEL